MTFTVRPPGQPVTEPVTVGPETGQMLNQGLDHPRWRTVQPVGHQMNSHKLGGNDDPVRIIK